MGLLLWLRPGIGTAPPLPTVDAPVAPTPSLARNTALLAFSSAEAEARAWQPDARLVQASATWTQGAGREDLLSGRASWDFTFISPSAGATAVFSVIEDEPQLIAENDLQREVAVQASRAPRPRVAVPRTARRAARVRQAAVSRRAGIDRTWRIL